MHAIESSSDHSEILSSDPAIASVQAQTRISIGGLTEAFNDIIQKTAEVIAYTTGRSVNTVLRALRSLMYGTLGKSNPAS